VGSEISGNFLALPIILTLKWVGPSEPSTLAGRQSDCRSSGFSGAILMTSKSWLILALIVLAIPQVAKAQGDGRPVQAWAQQAQSLQWLMTPQIQKELEIVPEQKERLDKISRESQAKLAEAYKALNELPVEERQSKYYELLRESYEGTEKQVREVLLPIQIKRLQQIVLQMKLQQLQWGMAAGFTSDELAAELKITDEQREEFQKKEKELREEIQKKTQEFYKKMQEESREKLMEVLTPEQRAKLAALTGPKFEWKYDYPQQGGAEKK
jgi:hypothetical protein